MRGVSSFRRTRHEALVAPRTRPADDAPTPSPYLASRHDLPTARPHDRVDRRDLAVDDTADAPTTPRHPDPKDVPPVITIDSLTKTYGTSHPSTTVKESSKKK